MLLVNISTAFKSITTESVWRVLFVSESPDQHDVTWFEPLWPSALPYVPLEPFRALGMRLKHHGSNPPSTDRGFTHKQKNMASGFISLCNRYYVFVIDITFFIVKPVKLLPFSGTPESLVSYNYYNNN